LIEPRLASRKKPGAGSSSGPRGKTGEITTGSHRLGFRASGRPSAACCALAALPRKRIWDSRRNSPRAFPMTRQDPSVTGSSLRGFFQGRIEDRWAIRTVGRQVGPADSRPATGGFGSASPAGGCGISTLSADGVPGAVELRSIPDMAVLFKNGCAKVASSPRTIFTTATSIAGFRRQTAFGVPVGSILPEMRKRGAV
jgi:hypothetical protein